MERLKIFAAAAALMEFTRADLAAYSGCNENTVRAEIQRNPELFEKVEGAGPPTTGGRPREVLRVTNIGALRAILESATPLATPAAVVSESVHDATRDVVTSLTVAERAITDACSETERALVEVRLATAANSILAATQALDDAGLRERADLGRQVETAERIHELTRGVLLNDEAPDPYLQPTGNALEESVAVAGRDPAWQPFEGLVSLLTAHTETLPPVQLLMEEDRALPRILDFDKYAEWTRLGSHDGEVVLSQDWGAGVTTTGLSAGLLIVQPDDDLSALQARLERAELFDAVPIVLCEATASADIVAECATNAACCFPVETGVQRLMTAMRSLVGRRAKERRSAKRFVQGDINFLGAMQQASGAWGRPGLVDPDPVLRPTRLARSAWEATHLEILHGPRLDVRRAPEPRTRSRPLADLSKLPPRTT